MGLCFITHRLLECALTGDGCSSCGFGTTSCSFVVTSMASFNSAKFSRALSLG
jgi:hypothetical protein